MRRLALGCIALFFIVFACSLMRGQTAIYDCYNGSSEQGGNNIVTNGIQSTNFAQQSFPGATVTVFLHNSATKASIFSDEFGLNALANPFSSSNHGVAFICAADGRYDIQYSNAGIMTPYTVSDIHLCFSCTGGGSGSGSSFKTVPNCSAAPTVLNETVQESNQVVAGTTQTCATVGATSSTSVIGLCTSAGVCGSTGNAAVATQNTANCIFDNAATQGDYVVPSTSVTGWCSDAGAVKPSSAVETLGNVFQANTGGSGTIAVVQVAPLSLLLPGSTGGSGTVANCASGGGANAFYPGIGTIVSCDPLITDDNAGHLTALGFIANDTTKSGFWGVQKGPALPGLSVSNALYFAAGTGFTTTYGLEPFDSAPTNGNCITTGAGDATNWFKFSSTPCGSGSVTSLTATSPIVVTPSPITSTGVISCPTCATGNSLTVQTNGVNNTSQTTLNFQNTATITASNPSSGNEQFTVAGTGLLAIPTAPTVTPKGTTGAAAYSYLVVAVQDGVHSSGATHYVASTTGSTSTGNATLSSTNFNQLTAYGDTYYGARGFIICRTAGGATQGVITGTAASPKLAGKIFNDTGLTADGTNCATQYATNTTKTTDACFGSALPGSPTTPGFPCGVDGPPLTPNALDDEMTQDFGAPADVNNPFWTWVNQGSATAAWSSGTINLTSDTTANHNLESLEFTLPGSTPYTFEAYISFLPLTISGCGLGMRESSTSKIVNLELLQAQAIGSASATGGFQMFAINWSNNTTPSTFQTLSYQGLQEGMYIKIQNTGTNIVLSWSNSGDGVNFKQFASEAVTTGFTTAPNQLVISADSATSAVTCSIDFVRRTQ